MGERDGRGAVDALDRRPGGHAHAADTHADPEVGCARQVRDEPRAGRNTADSGDAIDVPTSAAVENEILLQHVDDVGVGPSRRHREAVERGSQIGVDATEEPVDRVLEQGVATQVRADPVAGVGEAVRRGGDRGSGALEDRIETDLWPRGFDLDRGEGAELGIDKDLTATVAKLGMTDRIDESATGRRIRVLPQHDAAPLAGGPLLGIRSDPIAVSTDRVVVP